MSIRIANAGGDESRLSYEGQSLRTAITGWTGDSSIQEKYVVFLNSTAQDNMNSTLRDGDSILLMPKKNTGNQ